MKIILLQLVLDLSKKKVLEEIISYYPNSLGKTSVELVISSSDRNELNEGYKRKLIHILNVLRF
jgi:hypothetical protein